jgi:hypothetical protein
MADKSDALNAFRRNTAVSQQARYILNAPIESSEYPQLEHQSINDSSAALESIRSEYMMDLLSGLIGTGFCQLAFGFV